MRPITRVALKFFCRAEVRGLQNLNDLPKSFILASNHPHELDAWFMPSLLPISKMRGPIFFVSLEKEQYQDKGFRGKYLYGGLLFNLMGAYSVKSGTGEYEQALQNHIEILSDGGIIYIFPEGKTSPDGTIGNARGGVSYLSERTNTPVLPVSIDGISGMRIRDFFLRRRTLSVNIGKMIDINEIPVSVEQPAVNRYKSSTTYILQRIKRLKDAPKEIVEFQKDSVSRSSVKSKEV